MITLIDIPNRESCTCAVCGTNKSVKYTDGSKTFCNRCVISEMIKNEKEIGIEDLALNNLHKNRKLSAAFQKKSLSRFKEKLSLKCAANATHGKIVKKIDRFFPSSQICSCCGLMHPEMKDLKSRTLVCECGNVLDRDINAAKNILIESHKI